MIRKVQHDFGIFKILKKLSKYKPEYLSDKLRKLVESDIINVRDYEFLDESLGINKKKIDHSIMAVLSVLQISIVLLNNRLH